MRLSELRTGEKGVIVKVMGRGAFRKRIIEMGFIRGKEVDVIQNAPLKDPIHYRVMGYDVSLRRNDAQMIEVVSVAEFIEASTGKQENRPVDSYIQTSGKSLQAMAMHKGKTINVALVGNPNCGKTSLFNFASGAHEQRRKPDLRRHGKGGRGDAGDGLTDRKRCARPGRGDL